MEMVGPIGVIWGSGIRVMIGTNDYSRDNGNDYGDGSGEIDNGWDL